MGDVTGSVLLPDGALVRAELAFDGSLISDLRVLEEASPEGILILPGAVDLHGDGFESFVMPRPGVFLPLRPALLAADRAMATAGITTAFLSPTLSWEPGLRSAETLTEILAAQGALASHRMVETLIHLRCEIGSEAHHAQVTDAIAQGQIGLLSINDHLSGMLSRVADPSHSFASQARRAGQSEADYRAVLSAKAPQHGAALDQAKALAQSAAEAGVAVAWHDDQTAEERAAHREIGARIADFPSVEPALEEAARAGDPVIMGAPNVVRGGSHMTGKGVAAARAVLEGWATVIASDYAYACVPQAAVALWRDHDLPFRRAWDTVSRAPARAAGLTDRGEIALGQRADLIALDISDPACPVVAATWVGGRQVIGSQSAS